MDRLTCMYNRICCTQDFVLYVIHWTINVDSALHSFQTTALTHTTQAPFARNKNIYFLDTEHGGGASSQASC